MKQLPLVSVIIPTFNAKAYILETIESISSQNYSALEIIIVDDGSTDGTEEILQSLIESGAVDYYKISNSGGPSIPRNIGIDNAKGECIFVFDADDIMLPGKIDITVKVYMETRDLNVGLFFTDFIRIDKKSEKISESFLSKYTTFKQLAVSHRNENGCVYEPSVIHRGIIRDNFIGTSSVMITADVKNSGFRFDEDMKNADDLDMWLKISRNYKFMYVDIEGHGYRVHSDGVFSRASSSKYMNRVLAVERQLEFTEDNDLINCIKNKIAQNYYSAGYFHQERKEFSVARSIYFNGLIKSFNSGKNWLLFRGILVTYLKGFSYRK